MKFSLGKIPDMRQLIKELTTGLSRLDFLNNFTSFEVEITIDANTEKSIRNELTSVPKYVIINTIGNALVTKGDTAWSSNFVYLKNHDSTNSATVKAVFFKQEFRMVQKPVAEQLKELDARRIANQAQIDRIANQA